MEVKAKAKFVKMSPRKTRLVVDVIRGMETSKALDQLKFINKLATKPIMKLINSAIANAENNYELDKNNLYIKEIKVDDGPTTYRWMPRAQGRATPLRKRTSHINLILSEIKDSGKKEAKKQKIESPVKLGSEPKENKGVIVSKKGKKEVVKKKESEEEPKESTLEKGKKIVDPRSEGRGGYTKIEGQSKKGFVDKIFRRKSG